MLDWLRAKTFTDREQPGSALIVRRFQHTHFNQFMVLKVAFDVGQHGGRQPGIPDDDGRAQGMGTRFERAPFGRSQDIHGREL